MSRLRTPTLLLCLALVVGACSGGGTGEGTGEAAVDPTVGVVASGTSGGGSTAPATPTAPAPPTATAAGPSTSAGPTPTGPTAPPTSPADATPTATPDPASVALALEEVAVLDAPTAMATRAGDPVLYVAERAGRVRTLTSGGEVGGPVIDLTDQTTTGGERGLLGLAWSPDGQVLYLSSTDAAGATVLQAADVEDGVLGGELRTLLRVEQPASNHNGGDLHLGPDGMLWWSLGDGGAADDAFGNGQRPDTLLATLVRIDPAGGDPYAIPPDNPFADGEDGAPEVWAYGLRNPWRFTFDPPTGTLWVADVGQDRTEEVNRVEADAAGLNYGWPRFEGDRPFDGRPAEGPLVEPVHTYTHDQRGCAVTGGVVYRGAALGPRMQGAYLYSDFCDGRIWALQVLADGSVGADVDTGLAVDTPVSFGVDHEGEVYVLSLDGTVSRIVPG